jgi:hypothetical protein
MPMLMAEMDFKVATSIFFLQFHGVRLLLKYIGVPRSNYHRGVFNLHGNDNYHGSGIIVLHLIVLVILETFRAFFHGVVL